jgi:hypothetical protein
VILFRLILAALVFAQGPLVITNDPGGVVGLRAARVATLGDREVRIEGRCESACTMYLAAENVCVTPDARLGFHGPSFFGIPLPAGDFEYWSRVIASHYPDTLSDWFMRTGRHSQAMQTISGADMVRNGWARECGTPDL